MADLPREVEPLDLLCYVAWAGSFFPVKLLSGEPHKPSLQSHRAAVAAAPLRPPTAVPGDGWERMWEAHATPLAADFMMYNIIFTADFGTYVFTHTW